MKRPEAPKLDPLIEHGLTSHEEDWIERVITPLNDSLLAFPTELESRLQSIRLQALQARQIAAKQRRCDQA